MPLVKLYDTTLRDGAQGEGINFSLEDKLRIAQRLDEFGIHYIEGGWPGSNPKDIDFFRRVKKLTLKGAKICAFGATRRPNIRAEDDVNLQALLKAETKVVTIFGKSWGLHVRDVLRTTMDENLRMIEDSVKFMKRHHLEVCYDAEHFFDGYRNDPRYALKTLQAAAEAGADIVVLCDTNGGSLSFDIEDAIRAVRDIIKTDFGIHVHNDSYMAVANSVIAVKMGASQVQGTINGYGERCGNADLCAVIPILKLKMGYNCVEIDKLKTLTDVSRYVSELANMVPFIGQPFVGVSAFAHKGGMHVNAVQKNPKSFEHINPEDVGNRRRILISELSGKTNIFIKAREIGYDLTQDGPQAKKILEQLKELERQGFEFEAAEGSFEVLVKKALGKHRKFFDLEGFRVIIEKREDNRLISEATIKLRVKGVQEHTAAEGDGPINALDNALRKALEDFYPTLAEMHLSDFKVRVLDAKEGTAAKVRVLIESRDRHDEWATVGVSENIIEASWQALVDSIEYKLLKDKA